ncbi:hypothetical protein [Streptomyces sp. CS014]|uniref:zinc finger domain-containing protein n=1 Tax=Streptomyces sp. CS014 TaxID=2162707 RepID=UPI000D520FDE|nr:hypothetical protein [Streptomyces sp. CS014]PVD04427.1 hypothetical protein DBP12_03105 [Streptomyces sp. CS014]
MRAPDAVHYMTVPCPKCDEPISRSCRTPSGHYLEIPHKARRTLAGPYTGDWSTGPGSTYALTIESWRRTRYLERRRVTAGADPRPQVEEEQVPNRSHSLGPSGTFRDGATL